MNPYHDELGRFCSADRFATFPFSFEAYGVESPSGDLDHYEEDVDRATRDLLADKKFVKSLRKAQARFKKFYADEIEAGAELIQYFDSDAEEIRFGLANFNALAAQTLANGGLSFNPTSSSQPKDGYMVSNPENSVIVDCECPVEVLADVLKMYINEFTKKLTLPRQHLGTWYDTETKRLWIDVSEQIPTRKAAYALGVKRGEDSIFDVKNTAEIKTGGTGTENEDLNARYTAFAQERLTAHEKKKSGILSRIADKIKGV